MNPLSIWIREHGDGIEIPTTLLQDPKMVIESMGEILPYHNLMEKMVSVLKDDEESMLRVIAKEPQAYLFLSPRLKESYEFAIRATTINPDVMDMITDPVLHRKLFALKYQN